jgi:hypothetical protein
MIAHGCISPGVGTRRQLINLTSTTSSDVKVMRALISSCAAVIAAYWFDAVQYSGTYAKAADTLVRTIAAAAVNGIQ